MRVKPEEPHLILAEYITAWMYKEGFTYRDLAKRFDCSLKHAHNIAKGECACSINLLHKICKATGLKPNYIFDAVSVNKRINRSANHDIH